MVRRALNKVLDDFGRGSRGAAMVTQRRWPTFDEVWEQGKNL